MMLLASQIAKEDKKPNKRMIERAIKHRDSIYELIDDLSETPDLKFDL